MRLGARIAALRKRSGLTQEQLAQHLGTTRQAVSKWESDKSEPDIATLIRIGEVFQVSMDYLLLGKGNPGQDTSAERRKRWFLPCLAILVIGIAILLLLPLFASMYRTLDMGPRYTDANNYLTEWPMLGVVLVGILITATGIGSLAWVFKEKVKQIKDDYFTP